MALKFYASVTKELKLKIGKFLGVVPTFIKVTWKKWYGGWGGEVLHFATVLETVSAVYQVHCLRHRSVLTMKILLDFFGLKM